MSIQEEYAMSLRSIAIEVLDYPLPATESVDTTVTAIWKWISEKFKDLIRILKAFYYKLFKKQEFGSFVHRKILPIFQRCDEDSYRTLKGEPTSITALQDVKSSVSSVMQSISGETNRWSECGVEMKRMLLGGAKDSDYIDMRKYPITSKAITYASNILLPAYQKSADNASNVPVDTSVGTDLKRLVAVCTSLIGQMGKVSSLLFHKNREGALSISTGTAEAPNL